MLSLTPPRALQLVLSNDYVRDEVEALIGDNIQADVMSYQYIRASNTLVLDIQGVCTAEELADLYEELANLQAHIA
jgi:hypothetical protein